MGLGTPCANRWLRRDPVSGIDAGVSGRGSDSAVVHSNEPPVVMVRVGWSKSGIRLMVDGDKGRLVAAIGGTELAIETNRVLLPVAIHAVLRPA